MNGFPHIDLSEFHYDLPKDRIAQYPLENREDSKLLFYNKGQIIHHRFKDVVKLIPPGSTLFFNDTRVIPARIRMQRETGAWIEIFLIEPKEPSNDISQAMLAKGYCTWKCMIGNLKKWKDGEVLDQDLEINNRIFSFQARLLSRLEMEVRFIWEEDQHTFSEILAELGKIPLPPYVTRELEESDKLRYQTVYSRNQGAVAAPTAGLHFTDTILAELKKNSEKNRH